MEPTEVTLPNDGEFRFVSIVRSCGVLKTFVACTRRSSALPSANGIVLFSDMLKTDVDGPRIVLRPTFPNCPGCGRVNAAMLNHSAIEELAKSAGRPVTLARNVPLVPRFTSVKLPSTRAVYGRPEAKFQFPLSCQSPKIPRKYRVLARNRRSCPKGISTR